MMWPFKYVNGEQTSESKALEALPPDRKPTMHEICQKSYSDQQTQPEDALL